jgi:glycosyltransferase involved in cell wall biosynthesis
MEFGVLNFFVKWLAPKIIHSLRKWDFVASKRPDYFIANSHNTKKRIQKYYKRESEVIYPSINVSEFPIVQKKEDFYLCVGRCIPYKKFDLLVDTFNKNGKKLVLITNTSNTLYRDLKGKSHSNIKWKLNISKEETIQLFSKAKAFVFPPEEDFGMVPLEAMACGTPVIAYGK